MLEFRTPRREDAKKIKKCFSLSYRLCGFAPLRLRVCQLLKITFIYPAVGKKPGATYIQTWKMEPLTIATLKALTPAAMAVEFFDDRLELIDYETQTDLVAITVETYTARRAYQIAAKFRARGIPVILGGPHPTLLPDEAEQFADAILVGNAETVWGQILRDAQQGQLQQRYDGAPGYAVLPDRSIFQGKTYLPLGLVETGRGCPFHCEFCATSAYYQAHYYPRPVSDVVADIRRSGKKYFFLIDDNLAANPEYAIELCQALTPLKIFWASQASLHVAANPELLKWLAKSGCFVLLIGLESCEDANLTQMRKEWTLALGARAELVQRIHAAGISIYATFVFGFDSDTPASFASALDFSLEHGFFFAAFNHLLPFPGTPLYARLHREKRLLTEKWWLAPDYHYGKIVFTPHHLSPEELSAQCVAARRKFFGFAAIASRGAVLLRRHVPLRLFAAYWGQNLTMKREVTEKFDLPLGEGLDELPK